MPILRTYKKEDLEVYSVALENSPSDTSAMMPQACCASAKRDDEKETLLLVLTEFETTGCDEQDPVLPVGVMGTEDTTKPLAHVHTSNISRKISAQNGNVKDRYMW